MSSGIPGCAPASTRSRDDSMNVHPLRAAASFPIDDETVESCLDAEDPVDRMFLQAFRSSLAAIPIHARGGALAGVTGHVAESVVELVLSDLGYQPLWHFAGPGRHGIDLAMLSPAMDRVVVLEVKGTLRPRRLPRLTSSELRQMSAAWMDKPDNPGMATLGVDSADVYGGVAVVQFAERAYRIGLTNDFEVLRPVESLVQLVDLDWLDAPEPNSPGG